MDYTRLLPLLLQWPVKSGVLLFEEEVASFINSAGMFIAHTESSLLLRAPPIPCVVSLCIAHLPESSGIPISFHTTSVMFWAQCAALPLFVYTYSLFYSQVRGAVHIPFPFPAILLLTGVGVMTALKGPYNVFSQPCETESQLVKLFLC